MKDQLSTLGKELQSLFPQDGAFVQDDLYTRRTYSKDLWPRNLLIAREEPLPEPTIAAVVWPANLEALSSLVRAANERGWELYPYGAGSGVCGGATPTSKDVRPKIVVDLKRMDQIENLNEVSQVAKVQAGMIGQNLEEDLNARGFTMGHFPSSIYCSSLGGYLATRAAGQLSTYYGKIEDIVQAVEGVLPTGEIFRTPEAPRMAVGPDWNQVFIGSEGTLGFMTAAWVKIHRLPETRRFLSWHVESTELALDGIRQWLQAGYRPAVVRLYDEDECRMLMGYKSGVKLIAIVEGEVALTDFSADRIDKMTRDWKGWTSTGEAPAQDWFAHRYDVSYRQQQILSHRRMILDTFEVSTHWSALPRLHKEVKKVVGEIKDSAGGMLVVIAHFSHFYHCGGNIYFTLCGAGPESMPSVEFYDRVWSALMAACLRENGAISHHHGIGRLKWKAMAKQMGPLHEMTKRLKHELDPKHLLNPENLGL